MFVMATISDKTLWTKYKNKLQVQCIRPPHPLSIFLLNQQHCLGWAREGVGLYARNISTFRFKHQM